MELTAYKSEMTKEGTVKSYIVLAVSFCLFICIS